MPHQYRCDTSRRRLDLATAMGQNGIDFLEVSSDQKTLLVHFFHDLSAFPPLSADNLSIQGGVRIQHVRALTPTASGVVLSVPVDRAGDFSTYTFALRT